MGNNALELLNEIKEDGVEVCLVSKYWNEQQLMEFYNLGFRKFGENRVDVLSTRSKKLPDDIEWHFLGNIQSRDLAKICESASLIQSFDRPDLIEKLSKFDNIEVLIQINLVDDETRNGIHLNDLQTVIEKINYYGIKCNGFMLHPPLNLSIEEKLDLFKKMNDVFSQYPNYSILSMGTSNDYKLANSCGATLNRLGRVLFD